MKIQFLCYYGEFGHVFLRASRVAANEIRDYLLPEVFFCINFVEDFLKFLKLLE